MKAYLFLLLIVSIVAWSSAAGVNVSSVVSGTLEGGPTWTTAPTTVAPTTSGYSGGSFTYGGGGGGSSGGGSLTVTEKVNSTVNNTVTTAEPTEEPTEEITPNEGWLTPYERETVAPMVGNYGVTNDNSMMLWIALGAVIVLAVVVVIYLLIR